MSGFQFCGDIFCDKEITISAVYSGSVYGLTIEGEASVSTTVGYRIGVPANTTKYMAYKVKFRVEKGIRETRDMMTGKVIATNTYTAKKPLYGQYYLVTVND